MGFNSGFKGLTNSLVTSASLKPTFLPRQHFEAIILSLEKSDCPVIFGILLFFVQSAINAIPLCALFPLDNRIWRLNFCNNQPIFFSSSFENAAFKRATEVGTVPGFNLFLRVDSGTPKPSAIDLLRLRSLQMSVNNFRDFGREF